MSDPHEKSSLTVTIKFPESSRYAGDNPWLVFSGTPEAIRANIIFTFGLETETTSLADLVIEAQSLATAAAHASRGAGAKTLSGKSSSTTGTAAPTSTPAEEEKPYGIAEQLEALTNLADHKNLYLDNKDAFKADKSLEDAWIAKGKALKAA